MRRAVWEQTVVKLQVRDLRGRVKSTGSGCVLALQRRRRRAGATLWVVTCCHIFFVEEGFFSENFTAYLAGQPATPHIEALYPKADLALLRLEFSGEAGRLAASRPLPLGDPHRAASRQPIHALGYPAEAQEPQILTASVNKVEPDCLQFRCEGDLKGWSGGALVDGRGRLLGIIESIGGVREMGTGAQEELQTEGETEGGGGGGGEVTTGYALPSTVLREQALHRSLDRVLRRRSRRALGPALAGSALRGLLLIGGGLLLLGLLFLWLGAPFNDPQLRVLAPQLSGLSYITPYGGAATLRTAFHPAGSSGRQREPPYLEFRFRGTGGDDAGWIIVLWTKLFQNTTRNILGKLGLAGKVVVRGRNLAGFRTLILKVRGAHGGEPIGLGVKWIRPDGSTPEVKLLLTHRSQPSCWAGPVFPLAKPLAARWQEVAVPLKAFGGEVDWSSIENISLFWKGCFTEGGENLALHLAEIRFER